MQMKSTQIREAFAQAMAESVAAGEISVGHHAALSALANELSDESWQTLVFILDESRRQTA
jgi:hypothetical protein